MFYVLIYGVMKIMPPKRDNSTTLRLSEEEKEQIRRVSFEIGESESDIIRACIAIGLPALQKCALLRRVRLEDNTDFCNLSVKHL